MRIWSSTYMIHLVRYRLYIYTRLLVVYTRQMRIIYQVVEDYNQAAKGNPTYISQRPSSSVQSRGIVSVICESAIGGWLKATTCPFF